MHLTYVPLHEATMLHSCIYDVHRTRRDDSCFMWHQPRQRCKFTASVDIQKRVIKNKWCRITYELSESVRERRIALDKSVLLQHSEGEPVWPSGKALG